jgi:hypothetical protein
MHGSLMFACFLVVSLVSCVFAIRGGERLYISQALGPFFILLKIQL